MKIRDFLHMGYESRIRISLIFLILFLILLNFGTEHLFHQSKVTLKHQIQQQLSAASFSASLIWKRSQHQNLKSNLMELVFESGVNRISFLSTDGEPLISSREIHSAEELHIFMGVESNWLKQAESAKEKQNRDQFFSEVYTDGAGNSYLSCYRILESQKTENSIWIMVEKEVPTLAVIERLSRLNAFARTVGLFIAAFVTLLLVKNLLRPYRLMMKKAAREKIIPTTERNKRDGEMDVAVEIFEKVIRELKQKERVLQELYQRTDRKAKDLASYNQYILKSMTSGMIITDEEGKIRQINRPAERMLSLLENQVLGKHYKEVFGEENPLSPAIKTTFMEQRTYFVPEIKLINPNGESIFLSLSSSAVKDEQDKMLGAVVFLTDLTEIKKLEEEIGFKDKMAALGEMSSGLAHELRNSMGAVLGFSKLLTKGRYDSTSKSQAIDGIVREAMIMESMLQRFLAFAKPFQLKIEDTDIKEAIQECQSSVREVLKEKNITFELESKTDLPLISGDRVLLKQCFQNLIQNSIEAMPHGGELRIRLREEQLHTQEKYILVEVSDSGCGIAKADQGKIFNPFFTSREKGTGLGLSLVKKIISLHNGRIELESEPDRGTTFRIHLPLKPEVKPTLTESEQKDELKPLIFSHPINVEK